MMGISRGNDSRDMDRMAAVPCISDFTIRAIPLGLIFQNPLSSR